MSSCDSGSSCKCGASCNCGKMYPDVEKTTTVTMIEGVAPVKRVSEGWSEEGFGTEGRHGCKCRSSCQCDPCNC